MFQNFQALELFDLTDDENEDDSADDAYADGGDDEKVTAVLLQHEKVQMGKGRKKGLELVERPIIPENPTFEQSYAQSNCNLKDIFLGPL